MARAKVENKYKAILDAAISVFAAHGFWDTPTSLISKTAGVADGTLFNYFKTKDDLINEVYLEIKKELGERTLDGLAAKDSIREKMRHVWNTYVDWGVENPDKFTVMHQIGSSYTLDEKVKAAAETGYLEIQRIASESIAKGEIRDYPTDYLGAMIDMQAVMTVQFIRQNRAQATKYRDIGFEILWNGVTR
ncbi:MAG: TetR/AcrR family transcriptional regulator [Anaerolineae bacterium]|nr:TetR/AcrR family transcriptional regulator [Anaerolineae bacterium]